MISECISVTKKIMQHDLSDFLFLTYTEYIASFICMCYMQVHVIQVRTHIQGAVIKSCISEYKSARLNYSVDLSASL